MKAREGTSEFGQKYSAYSLFLNIALSQFVIVFVRFFYVLYISIQLKYNTIGNNFELEYI